MHVNLTPDQESLVRYSIETGRLPSAEAAVDEALSLWVYRERKRIELIAELQIGLDEMKNGNSIEITEDSMKALAEEINREGREILANEQNSSLL